ncbi:MAG: N-acetylmuramoyl-L-alanine amidase, partial [Bacteroidia bacterium]|nr:N-acetylmuramoyl-L-alanine amidase [Bacteroidia bacterium]
LIPNYYRKELAVDSSRFPVISKKDRVLVRKTGGNDPSKGLFGNSIALWHSHGYYFEMALDRWEWQRAKLFGTVEDISIMGYVVPYLTKMLENAGATVFLPRERDIQTHEVIVDNDRSTQGSEFVLHSEKNIQKIQKGFLLTDTLFPGFNPFKNGTSLRIINDSATYIPEIPQKGDYTVYISYPLLQDNSKEVRYIVSHTGGKTEFIVDQTMGGETWIYLGTFNFNSGRNAGTGSIVVKGADKDNGLIALDAVRFGGGMGNVARRPSADIIKNQQSLNENIAEGIEKGNPDASEFTWKLSGMPRFLEASRYWLQYAGMPDTLVYTPTNYKNDYNDDYQSRGLWVNYLAGDPWSAGNDKTGGLGLPVDLSLAFHSDAGVTPGDSIIGTLAIFYTSADNGKFASGTSRMASRDLSDIVQTQIVEDIRKEFEPQWTRRGLWDRPYSEVRRPNVPGMLLELLSHQNLADMRYNLDPRFRFSVSRSVYKGILKYLAYVENREYTVQPLPVTGFAITPLSGKKVRLSWEPVIDGDEPTSKPDKYRIYERRGDNGFGVLVVSGFDRISGPSWIDTGSVAGIAWWDDRGVPFHNDMITIGDQYDFNRKDPWLDDDSPGWGASYTDIAGKVNPGNNFNYPYIHGKAIMDAGYSFFSVSDEYFTSPAMDASNYKIIDLIFGEEKSTQFFNDTSRIDFRIYTPELMEKIEQVTQAGTGIFMSGAYVGSDLLIPGDSTAIKFAGKTLHFLPRTGHAERTGKIYATDYAKPAFTGTFNFNTGYSPSIYSVEAPDAIEPAGKGAVCSFRYSENNTSAGVAFKGVYNTIILGFPFETILSEKQRELLMSQILNFLRK